MGILDDKLKERILNNLHMFNDLSSKEYGALEFIQTNTSFDDMCGGILKESVTVIAGATGDGKSLSSIHLACSLPKDLSILYCSCENDIRVDIQRKEQCEKMYNIPKNFFYWNFLEDELNNKKFTQMGIIDLIKEGCFDIVFLDAWQNLVPPAENGAEMKAQGDKLMEELISACRSSKTTAIMTWQLSRGTVAKDIQDLSSDDLSLSIGVARYASHIYVIKRSNKTGKNAQPYWKMRLIKSRTGYNNVNDTIDLIPDGIFRFVKYLQ